MKRRRRERAGKGVARQHSPQPSLSLHAAHKLLLTSPPVSQLHVHLCYTRVALNRNRRVEIGERITAATSFIATGVIMIMALFYLRFVLLALTLTTDPQ